MQDKNNNSNQTNNNNPEEIQPDAFENNGSKSQQNHSISETAGRIGGGIAGRRIAENLKARRHSDTPNSNTTTGLNEQTNTDMSSLTPQQANQSTSQNNAGTQPSIPANEGTTNSKTSNQQIKNADASKNSGIVPNQAGKGTKTGENPAKPKASRTRNNNRKTSNLNPSHRFNLKNIASKHSKHSGSNDIPPLSENENDSNPIDKIKNKTAIPKNIQKSASKKSASTASKVASTATKSASKLIAGIASFIMSSPVVIITGLVICLAVLFASLIAPFIASLQPYGEDDNGNICFATTPCTNIIIKNGEEEKKYKLEEYIAGAMVEYYNYSDVAKYSILGSSINDNLLKALAVIIHSDISIYSDYDASTSTCTVTQSSKFRDVYEPTIDEGESDVSDDNEDVNASEETDNQESEKNQNTNNNLNDSTSNNNQTDNDKYYYQAKTSAKSVISQVVDVYSTNLDLKYSGYLQVLHNAADANQDYQKILKAYIKNNPNYISAGSSAGDSDNQEETDNDDSIGIYPICYFEEKSDSDISVVHSNDVCSTVHVNNGSNTGDYTLDKFIEGVVYNEARAWTDSIDTLKAHAVAARTYLVNRAKVENGTCYMTVGGNTMGFSNNTNDAIHQAVTETSGEYIMVNGKISKEAEWDALAISDGYYTNTSSQYYTLKQKNQQIPKSWINSVTLFYSIPDYIRLSHGRGMSQYGAYYLATVQNYSYKDIIKYYYDADISIVSSKEYIMPLNSFTYISGELHSRCNGKTDTHKGIDLASPKGTPVYAAHSGIVKSFYDTNYQCAENCKSGEKEGLGVKIDNGDGTYSLYMHFSKRENLVIGQKVEAGQKLGEVGNTGSAQPAGRGYHLHYQMVRASDGVVLNPRDYLPLDEKGYGVCYDPR